MPRFSVIVPCHRVQGFLAECLDSVLEQSHTDFEVVAVDDRSPDGCGEILGEYAARDERVRVVRLPENVGLGRARNAGMPHATGDYLLFLDGDDSLAPGALRAIADRLDETGDPDVLVFDYARTHWWGGMRRNVLARVLTEAGPGTFTAAERPEILDLLMVVWNKAYRRDFVEREGFAFPPGYYEDTPWTFPVLLTAETIAALDRVCLFYRQRRRGNILSTTSRRHFDIHDQYERVLAFVADRPELAGWLPFLHGKMREHCRDVLAKPDRLPPGDKAEFFRRTARLARDHRPEGVEAPRPRLTESSHTAYRVGHQAGRARRELGRRARRARRTAADRWGSAGAALRANRPLDPDLIVYSAFSHRGMRGDPAAIHHAARRIAPRLRGVWVVRDEATAALLPADTEYVVAGGAAHRGVVERATFFVNNVNWPGAQVKRPGSVHIHTHQGTPLKYMGVDLRDRPGARYGLDVPAMLRRADRWDFSLVASRYAELVWERAYPCRFASARTGSPRNDALVGAGPDAGAAFRARYGIPDGHTVVLYAPTRRDHRRSGHVDRFDPARLAADLGEGHTLVVRLHPSLASGPVRGLGLTELARRGVLVDATDEPHVEEVMLASDVLITDYSALMFDYAVLDRPIVVHADDWDTYRASRGAYFDVTAEPPGRVTRSYGELIRVLASGGWRDEEAATLRASFRGRFCEFDDGHAAERVVRTLILGEEAPPPARVPRARPAPALGGMPAPP
ncbi:bifunctional glycosyltransferase family 2 protein/CDP-glycerol:glycerophosphate glycerophosphotransferase [Streptomyces sp. ZYX-F-203]